MKLLLIIILLLFILNKINKDEPSILSKTKEFKKYEEFKKNIYNEVSL